jgi:Zn-dependent protease
MLNVEPAPQPPVGDSELNESSEPLDAIAVDEPSTTMSHEDWQTIEAEESPVDVEVVEDGISARDAQVLAELDKLQTQRPSWWGALAVLGISLLLYMGAAKTDRAWDGVFILVLVLAFHELGHYVTMRCFGYRNLRMFFIPFFGAAVSGQHYNIAGWKKVLVALAGPLPGVFIGVPLGVVGLLVREPKLVEIAVLMLILNGFNLLPFLPLDGGWVVHTVLFVRHPVLDVVFRVVTALCVLGLAALLQAWLLLAVAIFMLLAVPLAWRLARIAYRLKHEDAVPASADAQSIPTQAALTILAELRRALPPQATPKVLAQNVANVYETLNARPPGVLASLGLLVLYGTSFLVALVALVGFAVLQQRLV